MVAVVAVLVVAGLAVAVWRLIVTQYEQQGRTPPSRPRLTRPRHAPAIAPDDDPEFLAELARRTKRDDES